MKHSKKEARAWCNLCKVNNDMLSTFSQNNKVNSPEERNN